MARTAAQMLKSGLYEIFIPIVGATEPRQGWMLCELSVPDTQIVFDTKMDFWEYEGEEGLNRFETVAGPNGWYWDFRKKFLFFMPADPTELSSLRFTFYHLPGPY